MKTQHDDLVQAEETLTGNYSMELDDGMRRQFDRKIP